MSPLSKDETGHGCSILQRNSPISLIWLQWETAWLAALLHPGIQQSSLTEDRTTKTQPPPTCQHDTIELPAAADDEEQKEVVAGHGDP